MDYSTSIAPSRVVMLNALVSLSIGVGGGVIAVCFCHLVASGAVGKQKNFVSLVVIIA